MTANNAPPTKKEFCIDYPLYEEFTFAKEHDQEGWNVFFSQEPIDTYCPECNAHSIFHQYIGNGQVRYVDGWAGSSRFSVLLKCSRNTDHHLYFLFDVEGRTVQKIGQYPSLADLNTYDVRQYADVLPREDFKELTKAIGLAAHGVGVGSFVYLRRIFENLVDAAYQIAKGDEGWDEEAYHKGRMAERIQLLAGHLPDFLVENHLMYKILSQGLHELTESACLAAFPVVKMGIEMVLDEKLAAAAKQKKLEQAKKAIHGLVSKASVGQ
ncbi:short-chain dehydrogenase [Pseudomonas syringae]|uniref:short-chain dehydrogenase n=1 Tax=Pseudomonas syringae TaxID=317 RepID=UPI0006B99FA2|nr:short-chain dehydrogenase [Pseudomonas syringae]MBI6671336.1 short-chain dehydrogenase [Pseudomonas syringae]MCK9710181.1 short-chain dehydrogenase [Pseudomonas syringae pv. syringae]QQQ52047.1 short-chain dehydrogenase [Pseudomonas syringae]